MWCEFTLPNTKPFLVCTLYRPSSAQSEWIYLFEEELSIAQPTGLEIILMGDINIDCNSSINKKMAESGTIIWSLSACVWTNTYYRNNIFINWSYIYHSPGKYNRLFRSSLWYQWSFSCLYNKKSKWKNIQKYHTTTTFRCYEHFDESVFLNDLQIALSFFSANSTNLDIDFSRWHNIIIDQLESHDPVKSKRVKHKRLPAWFTPEISLMQTLRDSCKRRKQWSDNKYWKKKLVIETVWRR